MLINAAFLFLLGLSPLFGIIIPGLNLTGSVWNSLNGWLVYAIENLPDLIVGMFSNFKWQFLMDFINIILIFTSMILFLISGIVAFSKRTIFGLFGLIIFAISVTIIIFTPFIANYIFQISSLSDPNTILIIIDTNIIIVLILGTIGSYFSYFKVKE